MTFRSILAALLAASTSAPALAQDADTQGSPDRMERMDRGDFSRRAEDGARGGWQRREPAPPVVQPAAPAQLQPDWQARRARDGQGWERRGGADSDNGGGRGGGWQRREPPPVAQPAPQPQSPPNNVGVFTPGDGQDGWRRRSAPPVIAQPAPPAGGNPGWGMRDTGGRARWRDRDRDGVPDRRDWDRDNDGRVDGRWDRNRNGVVDRGYDWDRDGQRDGRRDRWGERRWDDRPDRQGWDRGWRADRRFDWQRHRYDNRHLYRLPRYAAPYGYGYRRFGIGITLDSLFFSSRYWINDPYGYRLPPARWPYRWVRYYDDVLLVDTRSGFVVDVIYDFFW